MSHSRRRFLQYSASAASLLALAPDAFAAPRAGGGGKAAVKKRILVLGGTGFLGPAVVTTALARGHAVTLFNRGKTRPGLFPGVQALQGDRDPQKGEGLEALETGTWDAVIDNSGYYPRMVGASARLLAPRVKQYVYVSSVSAYVDDLTPHADESAPVRTLADPTVETMGANYENYGGLKRACEQEVEKALPKGATLVRPGFIVGPEDRSDRFTWFPVRHAKGGEMLAPGSPEDPLQVIDVRDLGAWLVHLVEQGTTGTFNAVGPEKPWSMGAMLAACRAASGKDTKLTWVPADFLEKHGESGDGSIPIWVPPSGKTAGFHLRSNARAVKAGLRFRPPAQTVKDTLAWFQGQPEERRSKLKAGLPPEREAELLKLWAEAQGKPATAKEG